MNKNYTYHIITDNGYKAISAAEYKRICSTDPEYAAKYFEKFGSELVEVPASEHAAEEKRANHSRHLYRLDRKHGLIAYESLDTDTILGADLITDRNVFVEDDAILKVMASMLHDALAELADAERELIEAIYFDGMTVRQYAEKAGLAATTVQDRKTRILQKLKKLMNSKK